MNFQTNEYTHDTAQSSPPHSRKGDKEEKLTFSVAELAEALGIGRNVAYDLVNTEGFPVIRVGKRRWIIPRKAAMEWLNEQSKSESKGGL